MRSNMSGGGFYNSEPRNFNRGFGRGNPRPYLSSQPPSSPQPPRKSDVFLEAGKLAVEYLVSHGLLASNVLPGKLENGTLRNNCGESRDHRSSQERELHNSPNDQDMIISRSYSRERRNYETSMSRENGRVGSLPEKTSSLQANEVDYDKYPKDSSREDISDVHISRSVESVDKDGRHNDVQHETEMCHDSKIALSLKDKDDEELSGSTDKSKEETKDGTCNHGEEEENKKDESLIQYYSENNNDASTKENTNVTKVHSFLTDKSLKSEPLLTGDEMNTSDTGHDTREFVKDDNMGGSSGIPSSNKIPSTNVPGNQMKSVESLSFTHKGFSLEHESRGEKRALEQDCITEGAKKPKQWLSVAQSDEYLQISGLTDNKPISVEIKADQESFPNVSLPLKVGVESSMDCGEEKQLFSSSYKICDLNLMEASDMHENHGVTALLYPPLSTPKKELHVNVDLSMSDNCSFTSEYNDSGYLRKDVEIIDLESPTTEEGKSSNLSTKNEEAGVTSDNNLADNPQHPNDNTDGQDGYGFMISELLGNDAPNCSTVQPDINSLHNDMGLHHGEGIFSEDDPIYMSLGEIPLTGLLRAWEQPTQDRNPFEL